MSKSITIDGIEYVPKTEQKADTLDELEYKLVRTYSAGVFAGYLEKKDGQSVTLRKARRIWYWSGSSSLSELATRGTSKPDECKFPCEVDKVQLEQVIEILDVTKEAQNSINSVKIWSSHNL